MLALHQTPPGVVPHDDVAAGGRGSRGYEGAATRAAARHLLLRGRPPVREDVDGAVQKHDLVVGDLDTGLVRPGRDALHLAHVLARDPAAEEVLRLSDEEAPVLPRVAGDLALQVGAQGVDLASRQIPTLEADRLGLAFEPQHDPPLALSSRGVGQPGGLADGEGRRGIRHLAGIQRVGGECRGHAGCEQRRDDPSGHGLPPSRRLNAPRPSSCRGARRRRAGRPASMRPPSPA